MFFYLYLDYHDTWCMWIICYIFFTIALQPFTIVCMSTFDEIYYGWQRPNSTILINEFEILGSVTVGHRQKCSFNWINLKTTIALWTSYQRHAKRRWLEYKFGGQQYHWQDVFVLPAIIWSYQSYLIINIITNTITHCHSYLFLSFHGKQKAMKFMLTNYIYKLFSKVWIKIMNEQRGTQRNARKCLNCNWFLHIIQKDYYSWKRN